MKLPVVSPEVPAAANCRFSGGCGLGEAPAVLPEAIAEKLRNHPCYSEEAHHHFARMHVAVAPACNVQCHYCNRKFDCANESRPGVVSERLSPEEALRKVLAVAAELPQLAVVGVAGPGDPLANPERTFRTLALVRAAAPDLRLCVSTNGLALPDHVDELRAAGVDHVTVTINMVDPEVGARIHPWIVHGGRRLEGRAAAEVLSGRQLEGVRRAVAAGMLVKVNSVLVPGVNDRHLVEVNRAVRGLGAFVHNVMPLISDPAHGTHYGLTGQRGPTAEELEAVQRACEGDARVMRHCRQCRADAVGLLGQDRSQEFTLARLPPGPAQDAAEVRAAHRAAVERLRDRAAGARAERLRAVASVPADLRARVAVATRGEGRVNEHFGHAPSFQVYDVSRAGARLVGLRRVDAYCVGGEGEDDALEGALAALSDCTAVLVAKVGRCPREKLAAAGIEAVSEHAHAFIEEAALAWFARFAAEVARGERTPRPTSAETAGEASCGSTICTG
ncbi:nitrogenase cofactor biosynthesis protein NifB [Anaeromyxobacter oryzae]|uniref:FeMo cofactor biosynthesis protein NifB n=1 Tax=Anaeromyxobacter oryzae TaxID=2918170 RepID=A0ABM7X205_9BACT|nr:nitrogenase cofactor biosynthesis protein NifB [Anaeromyxobacter oryzae]BDG05809.1 FeMo cofactor biosynthesis protein NifB [Anaeromyxobacter oryzae]